ncbi:MAG: PstS family phosphate ABC transporter substrate-binding protein, partial [Planctomycetaceae bacterium]|nr:PstS family phosphate ABC transporter substrate-binding protein [Planctomycetaceae bacterium]
ASGAKTERFTQSSKVKKEIKEMKRMGFLMPALLTALCLAGCSIEEKSAETGADGTTVSGADGGGAAGSGEARRVQLNGSSTVGPIATRVAEMFENEFADVQVPVTVTGSSVGIKELIAGHVDIANASRPMKDSEKEKCTEAGIEPVELRVAIDGITVCVSKENDWVDAMTTAQLKQLWEPGSTVKTWKDLNPEWPDEEIKLYGPGDESGTFDYFTEVINGKEDQIRENYNSSENDNVLVTGIAEDKYALGFFGCSYYFTNSEKLKALSISVTDNPADAVAPTLETIKSYEYKPLSRPLFIYVNKAALKRTEVRDFVDFFLNAGQEAVPAANSVPLGDADLHASRDALKAALAE